MRGSFSGWGTFPRLSRHVAAGLVAGAIGLAGISSANALTFVIDFKDAGQGTTTDIFGAQTVDFDITSFGFAADPGSFSTVTGAIMSALENDYHGIVSTTVNPLSAIPDGQELDIDFVIGDIGGGASNGDTDFYYIQVGDRAPGTTTTSLGQACGSCVRDGGIPITVAAFVGSIFTDNLAGILGGAVGGDLGLMANVIDGTLAHEIGHTLGLDHCFKAGSVTNNGNAPLMGTGAFDMPNGDRLTDREFS